MLHTRQMYEMMFFPHLVFTSWRFHQHSIIVTPSFPHFSFCSVFLPYQAATVSVKEDFRILTEDLTKAQEAIEERDRKIRHLETDLKFARERSRITGQTYQEEKEDEASIGWGVSSQGEGGATGLQRAGKLYKGNSSNLGSAKGPPSEIKSARLDHRRNKQSVSSPPATQNVDRQVGRGDKVLTRSNKGANILDDRHDLSAVNALLQTSKHKDPETEEMVCISMPHNVSVTPNLSCSSTQLSFVS